MLFSFFAMLFIRFNFYFHYTYEIKYQLFWREIRADACTATSCMVVNKQAQESLKIIFLYKSLKNIIVVLLGAKLLLPTGTTM